MTMTVTDMHDYLVDVVGVTNETVQVVTKINGYTAETMCDILYVVTGYKDFEQYSEETVDN